MNKKNKLIGILLTNTGTPDNPNPDGIRKYLKEFLFDKRIIKIPRLIWLPILYLIILNIRPYKKTNDYKKIWMKEGSPLLVLTKRLLNLIKTENNNDNFVYSIAMRYGNPSIKNRLSEFKNMGIQKIIILPMFPQYSYSTTESIRDDVISSLKDLKWQPEVKFVNEYYNNDLFVESIVNKIKNSWQNKSSQFIIFTYHGLPQKYVTQGDPYYSSCLKTTALISNKLKLNEKDFITSFHSKFGFGDWTKPYTEDLLLELPKKGIKNISIISPTFSIDCLETLEEIEIQFKEEFLKAGGQKFNYISCLNDSLDHVRLIKNLVEKNLI